MLETIFINSSLSDRLAHMVDIGFANDENYTLNCYETEDQSVQALTFSNGNTLSFVKSHD